VNQCWHDTLGINIEIFLRDVFPGIEVDVMTDPRQVFLQDQQAHACRTIGSAGVVEVQSLKIQDGFIGRFDYTHYLFAVRLSVASIIGQSDEQLFQLFKINRFSGGFSIIALYFQL